MITPKLVDRILLTPPETAETLQISSRTLWGLTSPRGPIPCVRIGRSVRYSPVDLRNFIEAQKGANR